MPAIWPMNWRRGGQQSQDGETAGGAMRLLVVMVIPFEGDGVTDTATWAF
jgi:hypothetical protein